MIQFLDFEMILEIGEFLLIIVITIIIQDLVLVTTSVIGGDTKIKKQAMFQQQNSILSHPINVLIKSLLKLISLLN